VRDTGASSSRGQSFPQFNKQVTGSTSYGWWSAAAGGSWSNWYYYGDVPNVFWGKNYGYQWSPTVPTDWAPGSYKGECGYSATKGFPVAGVTQSPSSHQAHAILCGDTPLPTTKTACYARANFNPGNNQGSTGAPDWDPGYYKADCRNDEYVAGVAQTTGGKESAILCCPGSSRHLSCSLQVFYGQDSPGYHQNNGPDWDSGYSNGMCPTGHYVTGISANSNAQQGVVGAPHALYCCSP
jgi:hypothetical protein